MNSNLESPLRHSKISVVCGRNIWNLFFKNKQRKRKASSLKQRFLLKAGMTKENWGSGQEILKGERRIETKNTRFILREQNTKEGKKRRLKVEK